MEAMNEKFSSIMLSGKGSAAMWDQVPVLNANGIETNKVTNNYNDFWNKRSCF